MILSHLYGSKIHIWLERKTFITKNLHKKLQYYDQILINSN